MTERLAECESCDHIADWSAKPSHSGAVARCGSVVLNRSELRSQSWVRFAGSFRECPILGGGESELWVELGLGSWIADAGQFPWRSQSVGLARTRQAAGNTQPGRIHFDSRRVGNQGLALLLVVESYRAGSVIAEVQPEASIGRVGTPTETWSDRNCRSSGNASRLHRLGEPRSSAFGKTGPSALNGCGRLKAIPVRPAPAVRVLSAKNCRYV